VRDLPSALTALNHQDFDRKPKSVKYAG